ncbi:MAG: hypothetical protein ACREI3_12315, partial [Nitrospirales bacterium]
WWIEAVGAVFIAASVALAIQGWRRFRRIRTYLAVALEDRTGSAEHPLKETVKAETEPSSAAHSQSPPSSP